MADMMQVAVSYASPARVFLETLTVASGTTIEQAIHASGVLAAFPEIDLAAQPVGVFSKKKPLDAVLQPDDRVEIYRPLLADPKDSRRRRAARKEAKA